MTDSNNFYHQFDSEPDNSIVNLKILLASNPDIVNRLRLNLPGLERIARHSLLNRIYENNYKARIFSRLKCLLQNNLNRLEHPSSSRGINNIEHGKNYVQLGSSYLSYKSDAEFLQIGLYTTLKLNNKNFYLSRSVRNNQLQFVMHVRHETEDTCATSCESTFVIQFPFAAIFNIQFNKKINDDIIYAYSISAGSVLERYVLIYHIEQNTLTSIHLDSFHTFTITSEIEIEIDIHILRNTKSILCVGYSTKQIYSAERWSSQDKFFIDTYDIVKRQFLLRIEIPRLCDIMAKIDDHWIMCVTIPWPPRSQEKEEIQIFWINPYSGSIDSLKNLLVNKNEYRIMDNLQIIDRNNGQIDFIVHQAAIDRNNGMPDFFKSNGAYYYY